MPILMLYPECASTKAVFPDKDDTCIEYTTRDRLDAADYITTKTVAANA
jgi:hypothetical protein